jgi:hypothetical protein
VSRITPKVEQHIYQVARHLDSVSSPIKTVLGPDFITVYTNDRSTVDSIVKCAQSIILGTVRVKQVELSLPTDTIILKRHYKYQYRTWFRSRKLNDNSKKVLRDWVQNMHEHIKPSPSLYRWLNNNSQATWRASSDWTWDHFFVDHNDPKLEVWIAMVCPGIVRKTMSIQSPAK